MFAGGIAPYPLLARLGKRRSAGAHVARRIGQIAFGDGEDVRRLLALFLGAIDAIHQALALGGDLGGPGGHAIGLNHRRLATHAQFVELLGCAVHTPLPGIDFPGDSNQTLLSRPGLAVEPVVDALAIHQRFARASKLGPFLIGRFALGREGSKAREFLPRGLCSSLGLGDIGVDAVERFRNRSAPRGRARDLGGKRGFFVPGFVKIRSRPRSLRVWRRPYSPNRLRSW